MRLNSLVKNVTQKVGDSTFFKKTFFSFILITCLCTAILSLSITSEINNNQRSFFSDLQDQTVAQTINVNHTILMDIVRYCDELMENAEVRNLLYCDEYDLVSYYKYRSTLNLVQNISSMIHSVYFVNFNAQTVCDRDGYTPIASHNDQELMNVLENITPSLSPVFGYPRFVPGGHYRTDGQVVTLIFRYTSQGALVVNLDYPSYAELLSLTGNEHLDMIITDQHNAVLASTEQNLWGEDFQDHPVFQKVLSSPDTKGSFTHNEDGQNYIVDFVKNGRLGMTYISLLEESRLYVDSSVLFSILIYTIVSLGIALVLSVVMSLITYKPIRHLKSYVDNHFPQGLVAASSADSEFGYFLNCYQRLLNVHDQYKSKQDKERTQKIYQELLLNTPDVYTKYDTELNSINTLINQSNSFILQLSIDPESLKGMPQSDVDLLTYAIYNVSSEKLSETANLQLLRIAAPSITFLVYSEHSSVEHLMEPLMFVQDFILHNFNITFSAGIGNTIDDITEISQSYEYACQALAMRFFSGEKSIHNADNLPSVFITDQVYPYEIEDSLVNGLKALSVTQVSSCLDNFFSKVGSYHIERIIMYILWLSASIQRLEYDYHMEADTFWTYSELEKSTLEIIKTRLNERCVNVIEQIKVRKETTFAQKEIVDMVVAAIDENIDNPDLSVIYLAKQAHFSVNYLRSVFKNCMGESLSSYITKKKLEMIYQLLVSSDLSLGEIGEKLGYSTQNYFFTFFKKHTGMTPNEYRRKMKQQEIK